MASIVYFADGKQLRADDTIVHCLVCGEWYEDGDEHTCLVSARRRSLELNIEPIMKRIIGGTVYGVDVTKEDTEALVLAAYHLGRSDEYADPTVQSWYYHRKGQ